MKTKWLPLFVVSVTILISAISGCSQQRELTAEERAGETNFMGNAPTQEPLANAPGVQSGDGTAPAAAESKTTESGTGDGAGN